MTMIISLKDALQEVIREQEERVRKYPRMIQADYLHRDHANRQYKRMEAIQQALSVLTEEEWRTLRYRHVHKHTPKPNELFS